MAAVANLCDELKKLKFGPPPDDVKKYQKQSKVYTSESHPLFVDWLAPKYDCNANQIIKNDADGADDAKNEGINVVDGDHNDHILSIDFKIGMTLCPGKHQKNAGFGCEWKRDLSADLKSLKEEYSADIIVSLLSKSDLVTLKVDKLAEEIGNHGMKSYWYDIPDGTTPKDADQWKQMVIEVAHELTENHKTVVVHCMGGLNRTGMFVLSVLKYLNVIDNNTLNHAVSWIGKSRKAAGGNGGQIQYVRNLTF